MIPYRVLLGLDDLNSITCLEQCLVSKWSIIVVVMIIIPILKSYFTSKLSVHLPPLELAGNSKTLQGKS